MSSAMVLSFQGCLRCMRVELSGRTLGSTATLAAQYTVRQRGRKHVKDSPTPFRRRAARRAASAAQRHLRCHFALAFISSLSMIQGMEPIQGDQLRGHLETMILSTLE